MSIHEDEAKIRELLVERVSAMKKKDAKGAVAGYAPGAVTFSLAPPLQNPAPDATYRQNWFNGFDGPLDFEIRDLHVRVGGDVAFTRSLTMLSATPHGMPGAFTLWFRETIGWVKVDGEWKIEHEHASTPFHMDETFRAAIDLEP